MDDSRVWAVVEADEQTDATEIQLVVAGEPPRESQKEREYT